METLFTKIIQGEIPCYKIAENEDFFAFLDKVYQPCPWLFQANIQPGRGVE